MTTQGEGAVSDVRVARPDGYAGPVAISGYAFQVAKLGYADPGGEFRLRWAEV